MSFLDYLSIALFAAWSVSEILIGLVSLRNRLRGPSEGRDRFSFFAIWCSIIFPVFFADLNWKHSIFPNGFGSFSYMTSLLGYWGCFFIAFGTALRLVAIATLKKQFTTTVSIVARHEIVNTGIYKTVRHPAYLGLLSSLLGIGLASGNWFSLAAMVIFPLAATLYRIHVEEMALLRHFGPAYEEYASRTWRLLPGIW